MRQGVLTSSNQIAASSCEFRTKQNVVEHCILGFIRFNCPKELLMNATSTVQIDTMQAADWLQVSQIYAEGIASRIATFETKMPDWDYWDRGHLDVCRLVAKLDDTVVGWAALSGVSSRCVYAGVAEVSIYIGENARGQGVGKRLLINLVTESEKAGFWTLQAGVLGGNSASVALHEKCGFRIVGVREKLAKLDGRWQDVVLLERRSTLP